MAPTFSSSVAVPLSSSSSSDPSMAAQPSNNFEMADRKVVHIASDEAEPEKYGTEEVIGEAEGERVEATKSTADDKYQMDRLGE